MFMQDNWDDLARYGFIGYHYSIIGDLYVDDHAFGIAASYYLRAWRYEPLHLVHPGKAVLSIFRVHYRTVRSIISPLLRKKQFRI
jgi:hypothetical protein